MAEVHFYLNQSHNTRRKYEIARVEKGQPTERLYLNGAELQRVVDLLTPAVAARSYTRQDSLTARIELESEIG